MSDEFKTPEWTFRKIIQAGEKPANPQSSREFERAGHPHAEAGDPPANSLDAISKEAKENRIPVELTLSIWDGEHSIPKKEALAYFGPELKRHIKNIRDDNDKTFIEMAKTYDEDMSFLTIEDFNTMGLEGEIDVFHLPYHKMPDEELKRLNLNRFLWFFRAQNATSDDQDRRGSWGEGKFTLENASRLGAQITWSKRIESKPSNILMGQTTLRTHAIIAPSSGYGEVFPNGETIPHRFSAYGYFSTSKFEDTGEGYAPLPLTDETDEGSEYIQSFRDKFNMIRTDEPGTSILIPHPKDGVTNPNSLARAIIARWLITIFIGGLDVKIRKNGKVVHHINQKSLREVISSLDWNVEAKTVGSGNGQNPSARTVEQWNSLLDILESGNKIPIKQTFATDADLGAPRWSDPFWDSPEKEMIKSDMGEAFEAGETLKIIAQVRVKSKILGQEEKDGRLLIFMKKSNEEMSTTLFARHGMTIPFMDSPKGAIAIVHCLDDDPLAKILRHAEGPAHLEWNRSAPRIGVKAGQWHHGQSTVDFVRDSVKNLLEIMKPDPEVETHELSIFSITIPNLEGDKKRKISGVKIPVIPLPKELDVCRIPSKNSSGIVRIRHNPDLDISKKKIRVNLAYETSKGDSWLKYRSFDFDGSDIDISTSGASVVGTPIEKPTSKDGLVYIFDITSAEWKIEFKGFDEIRDVAVDVKRA